jgi:hypothetical protein
MLLRMPVAAALICALQACQTVKLDEGPPANAGTTAPATASSTTPWSFAPVQARDLPPGATWTGVYFNDAYGYLHLVANGTGQIVGRWKRPDGSQWGELDGAAEGAVVHAVWKEHAYADAGSGSSPRGLALLVFGLNANGVPELDGQFALDGVGPDGRRWHFTKQNTINPDLLSVP